MKGMKRKVSKVKNRLKVTGNIKDLITFIDENYVEDIYHPSDGVYPPNLILFFGKLYPTPTDIEDNKDNVYRWRMNNWGTPFLIDNENFNNEITILYKHSYEYTPYEVDKFNAYTIKKILDYSEMIYGENIHKEENELNSFFITTMTPPTKLIINWTNRYKYTSLKFRLDYVDMEDRYVGNIHYEYDKNEYILEHYVKEHNMTLYINYMLEEDIRTIEDYSSEIANMIIETNSEKTDEDYNEIYNMVLDELDNKNELQEQVNFISMMIKYLNSKKCNS
jgi:hypothetical protein